MLYPVYLWKDPLGPGQKAREEHVAHHQRHHIGQQLSLHIHLAGRRPERSVKRKFDQCQIRWKFLFQWIGLRENLQETMVFTIKYSGFL